VPAADLPGVAELLALKRSAADWGRIEELGRVRVDSRLELPSVKLSGAVVTTVEGLALRRSETDYGSSREATLVRDGRAWSWSSQVALEELSGNRLSQAILDHPFLPVADWSLVYERLEVVARVQREGAPALLVRASPRTGNAHTWCVDAASGRPLELRSLEEVAGMGALGCVTRFDDWREVGGLVLPFRSTFRFNSSVLGTGGVRWLGVETGVEVEEGTFDPGTLASKEER
jgi:hypothetical protein